MEHSIANLAGHNLAFLARFSILACTICHTGLIFDRLDQHLKQRHRVDKKTRIRVLEWASHLLGENPRNPSLSQLIRSEKELGPGWPPCPAHTDLPIPELGPVRLGGWLCQAEPATCRYITAKKEKITRHLREKHQWAKSGGLKAHIYSGPWIAGVAYQRFFPSGPRSEFFQVDSGNIGRSDEPAKAETPNFTLPRPGPDLGPAPESGLGQAGQKMEDLVDLFQQSSQLARQQEAGQITEISQDLEPNLWMVKLGAIHHLAPFSTQYNWLYSLAQLTAYCPAQAQGQGQGQDPDMAVLLEFYASFHRLISRIRALLKSHSLPGQALSEINRTSENQATQKQYHFRHQEKTIHRYSQIYLRFLTYTVRVLSLERAGRPGFRITEAQKDHFGQARARINGLLRAYQEDDDSTGSQAPAYQARDPSTEEFPANSTIPYRRKRVDSGLLDFLISVFDQNLSLSNQGEFDSILVSFVAVLAIEPDSSLSETSSTRARDQSREALLTWAPVTKMTQRIAGILTLAKGLILLHTYNQTQGQAGQPEKSLFSILVKKRHLYLIEGLRPLPLYPLPHLASLLSYGQKIDISNPIEGQAHWEGDILHYKQVDLSIYNLQATVRLALAQIQKVLYQDLLFLPPGQAWDGKAGLPAIQWSLFDNPTNRSLNYSFTTLLTQALPETKGWLLRRILTFGPLQEAWLGSESTARAQNQSQAQAQAQGQPYSLATSWKPATIIEYDQSINRFLDLLFFLIHLTSGQPARGKESLTIRHRNTTNGGPRNIIVDGNLVSIMTSYHKGYNQTNQLKSIYRYLPSEVGIILIYYLWLVFPFWEDLLSTIQYAGGLSSFLFPGSDEISSRRLASRVRLNKTLLQPWDSNRLSQAIARAFEAGCGQYITLQSWRQISTAIRKQYLEEATILKTQLQWESEDSDSDDSDGPNKASLTLAKLAAQTGHSVQVDRNIYGGSIDGNKVTYRTISQLWHRFFDFDVARPGRPERPGFQLRKRRALSTFERQVSIFQTSRLRALQRADLAQALAYLLGPDGPDPSSRVPAFRGLQKEALQAIVQRKNPVLIILGTGVGKSLCFQLPAFITEDQGVSIVVVPLVALQDDLCKRSVEKRIPSLIWDPRNPFALARLIFTTPESVLTDQFTLFIHQLRYNSRLDRIVIDECHTILESKPDFRPSLGRLGQLGQYGIQVIYLTATLPPYLEGHLLEALNWDKSEVTQIRASTSRPNITYRVQDLYTKTYVLFPAPYMYTTLDTHI